MKKNNRTSSYPRFIRLISFLLLTAFVANDAAQAAPAEFLAASSAINPSAIRLSGPFAKISDIHKASGPRFLIHIQDAHTNTGAEKNLAKTLEELVTRYKIKTVFIEGGTKDDSLDFLRPLALQGTRERVAKKYLLRGELNGAEYLSLASDHNFKIFGVEEKELYRKNLKTYAEVVAHREAVLSYIEQISQRVRSLKRRLYPKDILSFDDFLSKFRKKEKDFTEYHALLSAQAQRYGINLLGFPNFLSLKDLKLQEEKIDFKKANLEQEKLAAFLSENDFAARVEKLKSGSLSPLPFYEGLLKEAREKKSDLSEYSNFLAYVDYLRQWSGIKMDRFLRETQILEEIIFQKALTDEDAFYLYRLSGYLDLLKNLFSLQASREEFDQYSLLQKDMRFNTSVCLAFINRKLYDLGNYADVIPSKPLIDDNKKSIEDFYRTTEDRDEVFLKKALAKMEKDNIGAAVLITGGYHTQSLKQKMKEQNVSYLTVTPVVTEETNMERYENLLLAQLGNEKISPNLKKAQTEKNSSLILESIIERPVVGAVIKDLRGDETVIASEAKQSIEKENRKLPQDQSGGSFGAPGIGPNAGEPIKLILSPSNASVGDQVKDLTPAFEPNFSLAPARLADESTPERRDELQRWKRPSQAAAAGKLQRPKTAPDAPILKQVWTTENLFLAMRAFAQKGINIKSEKVFRESKISLTLTFRVGKGEVTKSVRGTTVVNGFYSNKLKNDNQDTTWGEHYRKYVAWEIENNLQDLQKTFSSEPRLNVFSADFSEFIRSAVKSSYFKQAAERVRQENTVFIEKFDPNTFSEDKNASNINNLLRLLEKNLGILSAAARLAQKKENSCTACIARVARKSNESAAVLDVFCGESSRGGGLCVDCELLFLENSSGNR